MNLEQHLKIKTGKDMVNAGIIPKTSSEHLALIVYERLMALRDKILAGINDEMLGSWVPAVKKGSAPNPRITVLDTNTILKYLRVGLTVKGKNCTYNNNNLHDVEGTFLGICNGIPTIAFNKPIGGSDLGGLCQQGQGVSTQPGHITLVYDDKKPFLENCTLENFVVADQNLGHITRFSEDFKAYQRMDNSDIAVKIPKGTTGTLKAYDQANGTVLFVTKEAIPGNGNRKNYTFQLKDIADALEVSSLGQREPAEKDELVRKTGLMEFFPRVVLNEETTRDVLIGRLMAKDECFHGPPGSGKTALVKDIIRIAEQQGVIFTVEGCRVQCNPYSLFDPVFAEVVPPCPECMIKYDSEFKTTGFFKMPKPEDVKVTVAKYSDGKGIEFAEGTIGLNRMHLAGYKLPNLNGSVAREIKEIENDSDPEGFQPGMLPRTNNGILHLSEMSRLRAQTLDNLLEALEDEHIKPDQLRLLYPANGLILGTSNDINQFPTALNDRMLLTSIEYPEDADVSYAITRKSYYNEKSELRNISTPNTHTQKSLELRRIPMPAILERAVDAFYMKFRKEYTGEGKIEISESNRSKFDALDAARAELLFDRIFYDDKPIIPDEEYASLGIKRALKSRVQEPEKEAGLKAKAALSAYVDTTFPEVLKGEKNTWWCRAYKEIAIIKTQIPDVEQNFVNEIAMYKEDEKGARTILAYNEVVRARANPKDTRMQAARIKYPFMNYLFKEQPDFADIQDKRYVPELVRFYVQSMEGAGCKIGQQ